MILEHVTKRNHFFNGSLVCSYSRDCDLIGCPTNTYDHKHRRVRKIVHRYDGVDWQVVETHTFVWDGMNIVLEKIAFAVQNGVLLVVLT